MGIKLGNLDISSFKVGSGDCSIYLGSEKMYPSTPSTPKWIATYTGGTTSSAECDSTSAITANEISKTDLVSVEIGDCVTTIGNFAFGYCSGLTSVTIGSGVTSINTGAFRECTSLTSIDIPSGVTSIGLSAFRECTSLTSIDIPSGVTSLNNYAFSGCSSLTSVTVNATTPPSLGNHTFDDTNDCPIYVPCGSVNAYKAASGWSDYASRIQCDSPTPSYVLDTPHLIGVSGNGTTSRTFEDGGVVFNSQSDYKLTGDSTSPETTRGLSGKVAFSAATTNSDDIDVMFFICYSLTYLTRLQNGVSSDISSNYYEGTGTCTINGTERYVLGYKLNDGATPVNVAKFNVSSVVQIIYIAINVPIDWYEHLPPS